MQNETINLKLKNSQEIIKEIEQFLYIILKNHLETNPIYLNEIIKNKLILHKNEFLLYHLRKQIKIKLLSYIEEPLSNTIINKWSEEEIDIIIDKQLPYLQSQLQAQESIQIMNSINNTLTEIEKLNTTIEQIEQSIQPKQKIKSKLLHFIYKIKSP